MGEGESLTEERALEELGRLFGRVDRLGRQVAGLAGEPTSSSALAGDDRAARGWGVSSVTHRNLAIAVEHLQAVRHLLADAKVLPVQAPYTLIRAALECAATAVWALAPSRRADRVLRCLVLARQDAVDRASMVEAIGAELGETLPDREKRFDEIARAVTGDPTAHVGRLKIERMVRQAASAVAAPVDVHTTWKACSGLAHGRTWATLAILHREFDSRDDDRDVSWFKVHNSPGRVLWAAMSAADALEYGLRLYAERSRSPYA